MDLGKIAGFFTLEAVATYIVALGTAAFWIYQARKLKQGRHIVCLQDRPAFSHLHLRNAAREWVRVQYVRRHSPVPIDTLSQVVIHIRNDSDTDVLNDVSLKFRVPDARVVDVWWEAGPNYIIEHSKLDFSPEDDSSPETWEVQVSIPHLKAFKKYHEVFSIGILADGDLKTIEMPPQGSTRAVSPKQVWTAKFIAFSDFRRKHGRRERWRYVYWLIVLLLGLSFLVWLIAKLFPFLDVQLQQVSFLAGILVGFSFAIVMGYLSQKALLELDMPPKDS